jgi:hypothetical protein
VIPFITPGPAKKDIASEAFPGDTRSTHSTIPFGYFICSSDRSILVIMIPIETICGMNIVNMDVEWVKRFVFT